MLNLEEVQLLLHENGEALKINYTGGDEEKFEGFGHFLRNQPHGQVQLLSKQAFLMSMLVTVLLEKLNLESQERERKVSGGCLRVSVCPGKT